ncbi:MAG: phosphoribosylanthranilate isomerase [Verrucomicrobia bacterium]|nr:phosphoribosylanthranilate isomerase [Verrucomicrobiota bacterium]
MLIKICGITNEDDALATVNAGANALGFVLWPRSKRFVTVEAAARITELVPPHVQRVAVLVNPSREEVERLLAAGAFDTLQLHGEETPEFCAQWKDRAKVWKGFRVGDAASLAPLAGYSVVDAVLLDSYSPTSHGGTGKTFDWSLVREAKKLGRPVILSGGLTPANVREAVAAARPDGVDVSSGVELSPGKKDHERIREFICNAKTEITT